MTRSARGTMAAPGRNVAAKAGLNRAIRPAGWRLLVRRLKDKAPGRVEKVPPAYTRSPATPASTPPSHPARAKRYSGAACGTPATPT